MKSFKIGKSTFSSEILLPGNIEIIFFPLEICNAKVPSIIIYKINYINYFIMKSLVKVKFANIINIINKREVIPELLQNECNAKEIYKSTVYFLKNPKFAQNQVEECSKTLDQIRPLSSSSEEAAKVLNEYLIS